MMRRRPRADGSQPGLLFMCLNADIERQFEFIQQTWVMLRLFHGLDGEVDSTSGAASRRTPDDTDAGRPRARSPTR